jgi:hypothetical protein
MKKSAEGQGQASKVYEALRRASAEAEHGAQEVGSVADEEVSKPKQAAAEPELETGREFDTAPASEQAAEPSNRSTPAVVPPPRGLGQGRIGRLLQRALERMPRPPAEPPAELLDRLDGVEVQVAALEELVAKRLEEGEGRTLHLVEKRLEVLQEEMSGVARRAVEGQIEDEARGLRRLITGIGAFAVGLAAAALLIALGVL